MIFQKILKEALQQILQGMGLKKLVFKNPIFNYKAPFFILLTMAFLIFQESQALPPFLKKDCADLYKSYSKRLSKPKAQLSIRQEEILIKKIDTCSKERDLWSLVDLLRKNYFRQGLILKQKKLEKKTAELAYYKWKNYEKSIKYYSLLLKKPLSPGERFLFQYQVANSYFQLEKYSQALIELEKCFFEGISKRESRKALLFKLQILIFQKEFSLAENLIKKLLQEFPAEESFFRESLAVLLESQNKLSQALEELEKIQQPNPFIKERIKRLEERLKNQP